MLIKYVRQPHFL